MRFKDQIIIVTGGGNGIGKEVALSFGREGAHVVLAARSKDKIEAVAAELKGLGTRPLALVTDVTNAAEVERLFARTRETYGRLDVLVNNAGTAGPTALARDVALEAWEETLATNLTGAFLCAKAASAIMVEQQAGVMINITSVGGRIGYPMRTPYAAAKWGMVGLSHSLAAELGQYGIRVNAVAPGAVAGERIESVIKARAEAKGETVEETMKFFLGPVPLQKMATEQDIADAVLFLASDAAGSITGQCLHVDGGRRMN